MKSIWKLSCFLFVMMAVIVSADEETKEDSSPESENKDTPQDIVRKCKTKTF